MPETGTGGWANVDSAAAASRFDAGIAAAGERDALITPGARERFSWEKLSNLPREVTSFKILGKSVGDLAKEAAMSSIAGGFFKIGFGAVGVGGIAVGGVAVGPIAVGSLAGGGVSGLMEIRRQAIENQTAHPERQRIFEKIKSINPNDKKKVVMAFGRGAAFGTVGGIVGSEWFGNTGAGQLVRGGFSKVGETVGGSFSGLGGVARGAADAAGGAKDAVGGWKDTWGLPVPPRPQVALPVSPEVTLPSPILEAPAGAPEAVAKIYQDPEFIKGANEIIGRHLNQVDTYTDQALRHAGVDPASLSPEAIDRTRQFITYDLVNNAGGRFENAVAAGVEQNLDVNQILGQGQQRLEDFLANDQNYYSSHFDDAIRNVVGQVSEPAIPVPELSQPELPPQPPVSEPAPVPEAPAPAPEPSPTPPAPEPVIPAPEPVAPAPAPPEALSPDMVREVYIPKGSNVSQLLVNAGHSISWGPQDAELFGTHIEANYDLLNNFRNQLIENHVIPPSELMIPRAELSDLIERAKEGDTEAIGKLRAALKWIPEGQQFKILSKAGISAVMGLLK